MNKLFLAVIALIVLEFTVLIEIGSALGALPTLGLLILMAVLGSSLVRSEGIKTLLLAQQKLQQGEAPGREVISAVLLALAGILLMIPGFLSDALALVLLQPWLRQWLANKLLSHPRFARQGTFNAHGFGQGGFNTQNGPSGNVYDGESVRTDAPSAPGLSAPRQAGDAFEGEFERKE
ncbi:MAG: FxsA family protein [Aeromonas sp.]